MKSFFTPKEVAKIVGISYRQMEYWDKTNFIKPSYRRRGKYRLYTFTDLIPLKLAKEMRDNGASIQRLRRTVSSLGDLLSQATSPLSDLTFLIEGDRILIFNGDVLISGLDSKKYFAFSVGRLREKINRLYPEVFAPTGTSGDRYHHMPDHYSPALACMQDRVHMDGPSSYRKGGKSIDTKLGQRDLKV